MTRFRIKIQPGCNMDSYIVSCLGVIPKHKLQGSYPSCACLWPKSALTVAVKAAVHYQKWESL